ncbi:MAG: hypothetical protein IKZ54_10405 [Bacteroidales bacterium]|nr:hypothetical protein [Bacteroidales bacterium]
MDIMENDMVYSERFYSMRVPEIKKVIGTDGIEREINEQCICDVNNLVRKMVADYKYTPIDLNDMITVLQAGNSAIVVEVESSGLDRAERAMALLIEHFKSADLPLEQVNELILHIQFTSEDFKPTWREYVTIEDELLQHSSQDNSILMGFSYDGTGKEDTLKVTAIAIYQS